MLMGILIDNHHGTSTNHQRPQGPAAIPEYTTIEELFAVFSKAQLDKFENLFLSFSEAGGKVEGTLSSMKQFIQEITIIPEGFIRSPESVMNSEIKDVVSDYEPHNLANGQYSKLVVVLTGFLNYNVGVRTPNNK